MDMDMNVSLLPFDLQRIIISYLDLTYIVDRNGKFISKIIVINLAKKFENKWNNIPKPLTIKGTDRHYYSSFVVDVFMNHSYSEYMNDNNVIEKMFTYTYNGSTYVMKEVNNKQFRISM